MSAVPLPLSAARRQVPLPLREIKAPPALDVGDTIYRRFFLGAIVTVLTAGATWGAWLLLRVGASGRINGGVPLQDVNAHGQAQIYGWVGLFVMGFAYQAFPRKWQTTLWRPHLAVAAFVAMVAGVTLRSLAMPAGSSTAAISIALSGSAMEVAAIGVFVTQMTVTFRRSLARFEPWVAFVFAGFFWFIAMAVFDAWHTYTTMRAADNPALLVWHVATYQAPLRDMQVHGLALMMVLGVSIKLLPPFFGVASVPPARAWRAWAILNAAVLLEIAAFLTYRLSGDHVWAATLMLPWLMLAGGVAMVALPWRPWRPFPRADRTAKFVRAAYCWLGVSLVMLLMLPAYQAVSHVPFSHAYYGAIRHAVTVGFVSLMILGMAARVVPMLNGVDATKLSSLYVPFVLVNVGCSLRVTLQTLTDWHPAFFSFVGVSGILEVTGIAWWGWHLFAVIRQGKRTGAAHACQPGCGSPVSAVTSCTHA